ncbi:MAG TPA: hypothetical protein PKE27_00195 [Povalibacter sp.]|uniref:phenylacetate--CoA ligase family protein n=1 Tax=Povalibacter sp. TaxID=1962978 RepID=UPI002B5BB958|nr:hypothetical protein [Povalibacter sp.]HMN42966.1 hypothetical protein [Povalibacter sp.]
MLEILSRFVLHPLWDLRDSSVRMRTYRELLRSQWAPIEQLRATQARRLQEIGRYAAAHSPHYREQFKQAGVDPQQLTLESLQRLPLLTKTELREHTEQMLSDEFARDQLVVHKTGGSTGQSVVVYLDKLWQQIRNGDELRANHWAGWYPGTKVMAIWGNPPQPDSWRAKLRSALHSRMIFLDTMNISDVTLREFVEHWRRERPRIVYGHAHSIFIVAEWLVQQGVTDLHPRGIVATSMMLLPQERVVIERAFGCKVINRYGCEEVGLIAAECEIHDGMHLNIEHLVIEVLREDGSPTAPGEEGVIVVTDLLNRAMPMIRYRVEDVGVLSERHCTCGRQLPLLEKLVGRVADYLKKADGSRVAGVSLVERTLTRITGLGQMQLVQTAIDRFEVRVVPTSSFDQSTVSAVEQELHEVFGANVQVSVEKVERIAQERSGKYRFSICKI